MNDLLSRIEQRISALEADFRMIDRVVLNRINALEKYVVDNQLLERRLQDQDLRISKLVEDGLEK